MKFSANFGEQFVLLRTFSEIYYVMGHDSWLENLVYNIKKKL